MQYEQNNSSEETEDKLPFIKRVTKHKAFIPTLLFIGIVLIFSFSSQFADRPPVIKNVVPDIGVPGDVLVITGEYFNDTRQGGEVLIAGVRPVTSSYIEWSDKRISVRIPPDVGSGLVYVITRTGRSNGILFTNKNDIPVVLEGPSGPGIPYISEITPTKGSVGTPIHIKGLNFGTERADSRVYFTPISSHIGQGIQSDQDGNFFLSARPCDFDYENWSENEIVVRVPDGASSGNLFIETNRGKSNSIYFETSEPAGTKLLTTKRGYQVQYGVQINDVAAAPENWLFIWVPTIFAGLEQHNIELVNEPKPYWDNYQGVLVYYFENIKAGETYEISHTYWFDRYALETKILSADVPRYDTDRKLYKIYTAPDFLVPSDDEKIEKTAKSIVRWEKNPYLKAKKIFTWLLGKYTFDAQAGTGPMPDRLETDSANSYTYSMLFCALLRSVGVPARPLSGYLVYGDKKTVQHYWAEFYIEDFGWVPVDPALADGAKYDDVPYVDDPAAYYFGNIDNHHILISRGITTTTQVRPTGRTVHRENSYSLQDVFEEMSPSIQSYRSIWKKMRVIDWW